MNEPWLESEAPLKRDSLRPMGLRALAGDSPSNSTPSADREFDWLDPDREIHIPSYETGRSFPLSLLFFLFTLASIFFAIWRFSHEAAILSIVLLSPGLIRTMYIVEKSRIDGILVPFSEQAMIWIQSSTFIIGTVILSLLAFLLAFFLIALIGFFGGGLLMGSYGEETGLIMGVVIGLPVGCSAAVLSAAGLFQLVWGQGRKGPVDMRN